MIYTPKRKNLNLHLDWSFGVCSTSSGPIDRFLYMIGFGQSCSNQRRLGLSGNLSRVGLHRVCRMTSLTIAIPREASKIISRILHLFSFLHYDYYNSYNHESCLTHRYFLPATHANSVVLLPCALELKFYPQVEAASLRPMSSTSY